MVHFIDNKGIGAYPHKGNRTESGFCYIYMGKSKYNKNTGIYSEPHKILGIRTEATIIETKIKKRRKKKKQINVDEINNLIATM